MHKYGFGSADKKGVYFDEQNRVHLNSIRGAYADGAAGMAELGKKEEARKLLDMADKHILEENMPYAMVSKNNQHNYFTLRFLEACYKSDYKQLADHVSKAVRKDLEQQMKYYQLLPEGKMQAMQQEIQGTQQMIQMLTAIDAQYKASTLGGNGEMEKIIGSGDSGAKK